MLTFTIPGVAPDPNARHPRSFGAASNSIAISRVSQLVHRDLAPSLGDDIAGRLEPRGGRFEAALINHGRLSLPSLPDADLDDYVLPTRAKSRRTAVRLLGAVLIGAVLYGCSAILQDPATGPVVLSWVTMGHDSEARSIVRKIQAGIEQARIKSSRLWDPSPSE